MIMTSEARFNKYVVLPTTPGGCMEWIGFGTRDGYGRFWLEGRNVLAHRFSYELFVGPIPAGLQIDHLCRNRVCVRPDHLEPVTSAENTRRGLSPIAAGARMKMKTHCPSGHAYDEENTLFSPNGWRKCKTCCRIRAANRRALMRALAANDAIERPM